MPKPYPRSPMKLERGLEVCALIAEGDSVIAACKAIGGDSRSFMRLLATGNTEIAQAYAHGRKCRAESRVEEMDDLKRRMALPRTDPEYIEPNCGRVLMDCIKWQAGKENNSKYGDKVMIEASTKPAASREDHLKIVQESGIDIAAILECYATPTKEIAQGDEVTEVTDY